MGRETIDATGLVVAPGFIDLHVHGHDAENDRVKVLDGVTTALELEIGTADVDAWYAARDGRSLVNYGVSSGHVPSRMAVFGDRGTLLPNGDGGRVVAAPAQLADILARVRRGLERGALGVGMGIQYTPAATRWEVVETFRVAAASKRPVFVHVRSFGEREPGSSVESFLEVLAAAAVTGAPLHIVHLNSMSLDQTPKTLALVEQARQRGLDVTTEAYPYSAGMTRIESALLDQYDGAPDETLRKLQWVATGERLTRETFKKYRREGGMVILHLNTPEMEAMAIASPVTIIASDGRLEAGKGHPRQAGTFGRVLRHYVRETRQLALMEALRKMTLMPAQRLEKAAPGFERKGRVRPGADADLVVFDAARVSDSINVRAARAPDRGLPLRDRERRAGRETGPHRRERLPGTGRARAAKLTWWTSIGCEKGHTSPHRPCWKLPTPDEIFRTFPQPPREKRLSVPDENRSHRTRHGICSPSLGDR